MHPGKVSRPIMHTSPFADGMLDVSYHPSRGDQDPQAIEFWENPNFNCSIILQKVPVV